MKKEKSIKKSIIMNVILNISNLIFPLITYTYVSRVLTPAGTGKVAFANSILQYFSYLAMLGIPLYGLRECAKVRDNREELSKTFHELLIINIIITIISYILLGIVLLFVPKLSEYRTLLIIMSTSLMLTTIGVEWLYQALEEYSYITIRSLIFKVLGVILTFALIKKQSDYIMYGFLSVITVSGNYLLNFINARKYIDFKKKGKYNFKRHLIPIITLFSAQIIITIYSNFDITMIGFISSDFEVGLYNAALKIRKLVVTLSTSVAAVMIPRLSYYVKEKSDSKIYKLITDSARMCMLLAVPVSMYIFIYSDKVLLFLCGNEYIQATNVLRILIMCVIPAVFTYIFGNQLLITLGMEKKYIQSVFIGMCINLVLNILLIPRLGAFGAGIGTLATEWWNVIFMSNVLKDFRNHITKELKLFKYIASVFVSSTISLGISLFIANLNVFFYLIITGSIFMVLYYLILILLKEDFLISQIKNNYIKLKRNN